MSLGTSIEGWLMGYRGVDPHGSGGVSFILVIEWLCAHHSLCVRFEICQEVMTIQKRDQTCFTILWGVQITM